MARRTSKQDSAELPSLKQRIRRVLEWNVWGLDMTELEKEGESDEAEKGSGGESPADSLTTTMPAEKAYFVMRTAALQGLQKDIWVWFQWRLWWASILGTLVLAMVTFVGIPSLVELSVESHLEHMESEVQVQIEKLEDALIEARHAIHDQEHATDKSTSRLDDVHEKDK